VHTYINGRYFRSDREIEILRNAPERRILDKLKEVYPFGRTAKIVREELSEDKDMGKSTSHDSFKDLKNNFFIKELAKRQDKELRTRDSIIDSHSARASIMKEMLGIGDRGNKYIIEDVSNAFTNYTPINLPQVM
jgi:hypothetical protein